MGQGSYVPPRTNDGSKPRRSKKSMGAKLARQAKKEAAGFAARVVPLLPWLLGVPAAITVALGLVAAILPGGTLIAASFLAIVGMVLVLGGYGVGAYVAFTEDSLHGWLYLFIPFYAAYYIVANWDDMWLGLALMAAGAAVVTIAGVIALPALEKAQAGEKKAEAHTSRPGGGEMEPRLGSIVHAAVPQVAQWLGGGVEHGPSHDLREEDAVVAALELARDLAIEVGEGLGEDGTARGLGVEGKAVEGWGVGREAAGEVADQALAADRELVQHESARLGNPVADRAVVAHRHGEQRRLEPRLLHPAREHPGGLIPQAHREDEQTARHAPQGLAKRSG